MSRRIAWSLLCTLVLVFLHPLPTTAAPKGSIAVAEQRAAVVFPEKITFEATITSTEPIQQVVLEYGVVARTCGKVTAKAFPDFEPGTTAEVAWTWEMRQSGSEPPGARIWYRWRVKDASGQEYLSDQQTVVWLDDQHDWQSNTQGMLTLHSYYEGSSPAAAMLASASSALEDLHRTTGIRPQTPIDLYIYANNDDMQDAVLYEPGWTGGQAYPTRNIVIIGIAPENMEWGKRTLAHELTHVLVGHLAFTCLGDVPTWLNEGIAVYAEGVPEQATVEQLQQAVEDDTLISVRALSGGFSEHPGRADLSYAQSWSLVNFLVKEHGQDKLLALFGALRDGLTIEDALRSTYEFGLEGLERNWRGALKARPRQDTPAAPTPTQLRTPVPTYPPIVAAPEARAEARVAPTLIAATTTSNSTAAAGGTTDSESLQLSGVSPLVYAAIFSFLGLGGVGFWYFFRRRRRT